VHLVKHVPLRNLNIDRLVNQVRCVFPRYIVTVAFIRGLFNSEEKKNYLNLFLSFIHTSKIQ
jgi:hypothetical protein